MTYEVIFHYSNGDQITIDAESQERADSIVEQSFRLITDYPDQKHHINRFADGFIDLAGIRRMYYREKKGE